ncbi:cation:proton antiporter [Dongia soli]|uniref:Sodium:proton antiporter n=1 Tax=Dongia soli TaxID=600628 RepID=A0ABU5EEN2_9PROT|nr:sodium:proton antiporter [Dongia soli]MDY0884663.1 sodium:proton antiporter [Dongia soli]
MEPTGLSPFEIAAILIFATTVLAYLNYHLLHLPPAIALTLMGSLAAVAVIALDHAAPELRALERLRDFLDRISLRATLLNGLLSFLLFSLAVQVDFPALRRNAWQVMSLSSISVVLSTAVIAIGFWLVLGWLGAAIPFLWCLIFGALISPTDPTAVEGVTESARIPASLKATLAGESLFNDGVAIVLFSLATTAALAPESFTWSEALLLFCREAIGGVLFGMLIGWLALQGVRRIDDYKVEVMISLALVLGGYTLAQTLHVSGPVTAAMSGLIFGYHGVEQSMSRQSREYSVKFWVLIGDILNMVLFLLVGLELAANPAPTRLLLISALAAIPVALIARLISTALPLILLHRMTEAPRVSLGVLLWAGARGGVSIALALSVPRDEHYPLIFAATYAVVVFTVLVQGLTLRPLLRARSPAPANPTLEAPAPESSVPGSLDRSLPPKS